MALVDVEASEAAEPADNVFVAPTSVPPAEQFPPFVVTCAGPQRKKSTVPVAVGPEPLTVAVSVTDVPGTTEAPCDEDAVVVDDGCKPNVKHSFDEVSSLDPS